MKTAKLTLISTVAAALGLAVALGATPAAAFHCKGAHDFDGCEPGGGGGGDGGGQSGKGLKLVVTIELDDTILIPDSNAPIGEYVDKEGAVTATTGGETQPNAPGFGVSLTGKGKNPRMVTVVAKCVNGAGPSFIPGGCNALPLDALFTERAEMGWRVRPYEVNCPGFVAGGDCPDVFTMAVGTPELMSYRVSFIGAEAGFIIEFASAIGGAGGPNPGRCLSLLSPADRMNFLADNCDGVEEECNVLVMAHDDNGDGSSDAWDVDGTGLTGLICDVEMGGGVYGIYMGGADVAWSAEEKP